MQQGSCRARKVDVLENGRIGNDSRKGEHVPTCQPSTYLFVLFPFFRSHSLEFIFFATYLAQMYFSIEYELPLLERLYRHWGAPSASFFFL